MASSHEGRAWQVPCGGVRAASLLLAAVLCACALLCPRAAFGEVSALKLDPQPLAVEQVQASAFATTTRGQVEDGTARLSIARLCPMAVTATCDPASIEAGISCGMDWMCGLRPCLCGAADEWGGCACNGTETVCPDVTFTSSDEGIVRVVQFAGKTWLVPVGEGTATVTCSAALRYHEDAQAAVEVTVGGMTGADAALIGCCVGAAAIVAALVAAICMLVRRMRRKKREKAAR